MNRDDFEAWFRNTGTPMLNRFHQWGTDAQGNRAVFWMVVFFALLGVVGVVTVIRWVL